jgi:hypothetical protein
MIVKLVAKRNYEDFLRWLSQEGITGDPTFAENVRKEDARNCGIPGCSGTEANAAITFAPYKQGTVLLCKQHFAARSFVDEQANGYRVLREMEPNARRQDPDLVKRRKAIIKLFPKYKGTKNYVESICRELQKQKERMPAQWLIDWASKDFRVERTDWLVAYQNPEAKGRIQKYISKFRNPKPRKSN